MNASAPVCYGAQSSAGISDKLIVVAASRNFRSSEARAYFERLRSRDRKHSLCKLSLKLVEDRLAEPSGDISDNASHSPANGVVGLFGPHYALESVSDHFISFYRRTINADLSHSVRSFFVRTSGQILVHILASNRREEMDKVFGQSIFDVIVVFVVVNRSERRGRQRRWKMDLSNGTDKGYDLDAIGDLEVLLGDGTCGNATCTWSR